MNNIIKLSVSLVQSVTMSIGEAALANLQQQITNLQNQINNLQAQVNAQSNEISSFETYVGTQLNNLQNQINNKVSIVSQMPGYQGLQVNGNLNGYLDVFKIQLLSTDNPQFFIFNWMQMTGIIGSYTNDIQWPVSATPRMYYQSSTYIVAPGVYTISGQGCVYQMQFNSSAHTFHLYLESQVLADKEFKKLGISPPNVKESPNGKYDITNDEIVKEFSAEALRSKESPDDIAKQKQQPSIPLIGANNDYVTFLVMAYY